MHINLHIFVRCSGSYGVEPYLEVKTVRVCFYQCYFVKKFGACAVLSSLRNFSNYV